MLFVDDEPMLCKLVSQQLKHLFRDKVDVSAVTSADRALQILSGEEGSKVRLVVTDLSFDQGIDGRELVERALEIRPDLRGALVVTTGMTLEDDDPLFAVHGCLRLDKPLGLLELVGVVREATGVEVVPSE